MLKGYVHYALRQVKHTSVIESKRQEKYEMIQNEIQFECVGSYLPQSHWE